MSVSKLPRRLTLIAVLSIGLLGVGIGAGVGGLESHMTSASDTVGLLPATRITALPRPTILNGVTPLRVRLSGVPAPFSPHPALSPAVAGTWTRRGKSEFFTPKVALEPCSTYTLTVWAASTATGHSPLGKRRSVPLHVACPSVRGLQQILARLDYLPYEAHSIHSEQASSSGEASNSGEVSSREPSSRAALTARYAFDPPSEAPRARLADAPALEYGELDGTTKGALMVFQSDHGIEPTGTPESATWQALFKAAVHDERNHDSYTFVTVTESIPETLEVHRGNHVVLSTPANTGVAGAETAQGIFPIFSRFTSTTMVGTNPDGTKYSDPGVPWVNYFNGGDAVHGFPRGSYGTPQSNGCVELPISTAETVFGMLKLGDIVEVTS
ncbi:MAG TPA: L,D-transpeptidase family protein [Solirubrobacteraceae bacterium]|jgi:lipoprotein-anchoring transpeptidase ErfK/SrfK|nr:L,D-transpeptidase family protein [Solirubrobacteraceae bacterium]